MNELTPPLKVTNLRCFSPGKEAKKKTKTYKTKKIRE
jgi:hypothetical protein